MKILATVLMLFTFLVSQPLFAHGDHNHASSPEAAVKTLAQAVVKDLALHDGGLGFGQLSENWTKVPTKNITISEQGNGYSIVSVFNADEKKTLYILMSDDNEVYDVNLTGEFEGVN